MVSFRYDVLGNFFILVIIIILMGLNLLKPTLEAHQDKRINYLTK